MIWKRKYMVIVTIACAIALFSSVVYVAASPAWDIDDMVAWMETRGSVYIPRITRWTRQIKEMMGQGLVGEWYATYGPIHPTYDLDIVDIPAGQTTVFQYTPPHPKKFTFWAEGDFIPVGENIRYRVYYDADGGGGTELYRSYWVYNGDAALVLNQLPISEFIRITAEPSTPGVCDVEGSVIIEEV